MKKRLISMLLLVVMVLGMLPVTALAAGSEEEALGEVNIYNGEQKLSYRSINGRIRELIYTYFNHVDAVLSVLKHAVFVDIPCLQRVSPRRTGIKQLGDLLCPPRPEALRRDICGNGQVDLHLV